MMIFIKVGLGRITLYSISHCTLDNYNVEFSHHWIPIWNHKKNRNL